jgi:hypothetical protein
MGARARRVAAVFAVLAASLVGGGVVLGLGPTALLPTAGAATCTSGGGVSVVVDYRELGGGVTTACAADGAGKSATAIVESVGVSLTYAQRQPGFVCRVNGVPTSDPCVTTSPADAYWGLWWSDGKSGSWTYSSYSSGSLTVPAGGSVGWAWKQGSGNAAPPGVAPPVFAASPSPTSSPSSAPTSSPSSSPTSSPSSSPSGGGGSGSGSGGGSPSSPSPSGGNSPESSPSSSPSASASSTPSESPLASESPGDSRSPAGSGDREKKRSGDRESPGDSRLSDQDDPTAEPLESPGDSTASDAPATGQPAADEPTKVPAAVTWGAVGLLGAAVAVSALVARRRREPGAS